MPEPGLTVVIPVHNNAAGLVRTTGAIDRTCSPCVRIIIVDDGSADDTPSAVAAILDRHPAWRAVTTANRGPSAARNTGAEIADTPAIAFLDANDEPLPGWQESLERCLEAGVAMAHCHPSLAPEEPTQADEVHATSDAVYLPGCFAIRQELFRAIGGYDEQLWFGENSDLVERGHRACHTSGQQVIVTPEPLLRVNDPSDPRRHDRNRMLSAHHILRRDASRLRTDREQWERYASIGAVAGFRVGEWRRSVHLAAVAVRVRPTRARNWVRLALIGCPPLGRRRWPRNGPSA